MVRLKVGQKRPSKDNMALPALTSISIPISITRGIHFLPHDHTHTQTHISVPTLLHSFYSRGNRGEPIFSPFSLSGGHPHSLLCVTFLQLQSPQWLVESSCLITLASSLSPSSTSKDPCDHIGPIWAIQDNLPILKSANYQLSLHLQSELPFAM